MNMVLLLKMMKRHYMKLLSNDEKIQYYHEKAIERAVFFKKETRVREVEEMFEEL